MLDLLTQISGPDFLVYFLFWSAGCVGLGLMSRFFDGTRAFEVPQVEDFDAVSIAALRGGARAVIEVVLYSLYERGIVEQDVQGLVAGSTAHQRLTRYERCILKQLSSATQAQVLLKNGALEAEVDSFLGPVYDGLRVSRLMLSEAEVMRSVWIGLGALAVALAPGLAKMMIGMSRNRPVTLLVVELLVVGVVGAIALWPSRKTTALGRRLLREVERRFEWARTDKFCGTRNPEVAEVAVAIFGVSFLSASQDHLAFAQGFVAPTAVASNRWRDDDDRWGHDDRWGRRHDSWSSNDSNGGGGCGGGSSSSGSSGSSSSGSSGSSSSGSSSKGGSGCGGCGG